jgi:AraC-like DNA-binding protein
MNIPNRVLNVDHLVVDHMNDNDPMLIGLCVPGNFLSEAEYGPLVGAIRDPGLGTVAWGQALCELVTRLEARDWTLCEKEEHVRSFVVRAFSAASNQLADSTPIHCHTAVQRAKEYIHANYSRAFSLSDVAQESQLSKWHLAHCFQEDVGQSIGGYTRQIRAHHALRLLRSGVKPSIIAAELGYSDQSHFTRDIRGLFGFTPGQYARAHRPEVSVRSKLHC